MSGCCDNNKETVDQKHKNGIEIFVELPDMSPVSEKVRGIFRKTYTYRLVPDVTQFVPISAIKGFFQNTEFGNDRVVTEVILRDRGNLLVPLSPREVKDRIVRATHEALGT